jgi:orotate phosphoribosyltransferase
MAGFDQDAFYSFIQENGVYGFFDKPITLKSGRQSHFYVNWRTVVEDVWLTEQLVQFVIDYVEANDIPVDTFYGVPEGATKLGVLTQFHWAKRQSDYGRGSHALAMGRAKPKEHGAPKDRFFVGRPRGKVVMLEDATTTGGSSISAIKALQDASIDISALISLTNRMEKRDDGSSVEDAVGELGVKFYSMSSAIDLLPRIYAEAGPSDEVGKALEREFEEYGLAPLKLL